MSNFKRKYINLPSSVTEVLDHPANRRVLPDTEVSPAESLRLCRDRRFYKGIPICIISPIDLYDHKSSYY